MAQPLDNALNALNTTIESIGTKVTEQIRQGTAYKTAILGKLGEVANNLEDIIKNSNLQSIPLLQQQITQLKQQLNDKTSELQAVQENLKQSTQRITDLETNINDLTRQINDKDKQIQDLTNANAGKDTEIKNLNDQKQALEQQKKSAEDALAAANQQVTGLVQQIDTINRYLLQQVQLIDTISKELGTIDSGDIAQQFNIISTNIDAIRKLINTGSGGAEAAQAEPLEPDFGADIEDLYNLFISSEQLIKDQFYRTLNQTGNSSSIAIIQNNIRRAIDTKDAKSITKIKSELKKLKDSGLKFNFNPRGGKRRHKTMKKRHRRTRKKMRGGYIYSASKQLDKESSVISSSSSSKSKSKSKSKSQIKDKTRRKYMK